MNPLPSIYICQPRIKLLQFNIFVVFWCLKPLLQNECLVLLQNECLILLQNECLFLLQNGCLFLLTNGCLFLLQNGCLFLLTNGCLFLLQIGCLFLLTNGCLFMLQIACLFLLTNGCLFLLQNWSFSFIKCVTILLQKWVVYYKMGPNTTNTMMAVTGGTMVNLPKVQLSHHSLYWHLLRASFIDSLPCPENPYLNLYFSDN